MRLLLTSAGITNTSIVNALAEMLGKPIAEATALVIPTAAYPAGGPAAAWRIVAGRTVDAVKAAFDEFDTDWGAATPR